MPFYLKPHSANPYAYRYARHTDINLYFGFQPGQKVPRDFEGVRNIPVLDLDGDPLDGTFSTEVRYSHGAPMRMGNFGRLIKSSKHRVHARCLSCQEWVPAGRVHQHKCKGK